MQKKDIICQMPFYGMDITPEQKFAPCCKFAKFETLEESDSKDPFYSSLWEDARQNIIAGNPVSNCSACYKAEANGEYSIRQLFLDTYKNMFGTEFDPDNATPVLRSVNIAFSNLCNNSCRMCSARFSTSWYKDAERLGWKIPRGKINHKELIDQIDFSEVYLLHFVGGEPMLMQDEIIELLLSRGNLNTLSVNITTNVTTLPNKKLIDLLNQCRSVTWDLSVDAYGPLNNFLRKGSDWNFIEQNIEWYVKNYKNVRLQSAISTYNINCFDKLSRYSKQLGIDNYHHMVFDVDEMLPRHLPEHAKREIKVYIKNIKKELDLSICDAILEELNQKGNFQIFEDRDKKLNSLRNEHWKDVNRPLYELIYNRGKL